MTLEELAVRQEEIIRAQSEMISSLLSELSLHRALSDAEKAAADSLCEALKRPREARL